MCGKSGILCSPGACLINYLPLLQDTGHHLSNLWLPHTDRLHDLLCLRMPRRQDTLAGAQRGSVLDAPLAEEHRLYAAGD